MSALEPVIMLSQKQVKELKAKGLWKEPVMRPDNYFEDLISRSLKHEVQRLGLSTKQNSLKDENNTIEESTNKTL